MQVAKRDGRIVEFEEGKIIKAVEGAAKDAGVTIPKENMDTLVGTIAQIVTVQGTILSVEEIQNLVEEALMALGHLKTAKAYILYRAKRNEVREKGWEMTDLQRDILERKYLFEGESFNSFLERVGYENRPIQKMIRDKKFLPAGRILMGRRLFEHGKKVTYSNCFVITPPEDNLESIFDTAKKMARTYSYGGGSGTSLEYLRPRRAKVNNSAKETTGAVSFMDLYSLTTGLIGQQGRRK